jgi:hypothetical protein
MRMTVQASKPLSGSQWSEVESLSARDARRLQDHRLRRDELRRTVEDRVRSALNVKTVVEPVPEGTLKRPDHVKVALIERVHG